MKIILGTSRQQMQFSSLDDFIAADNPVRIIDAFAEKLDPLAIGLQKTGIEQHSDTKKKTHPGGAPVLMTSSY